MAGHQILRLCLENVQADKTWSTDESHQPTPSLPDPPAVVARTGFSRDRFLYWIDLIAVMGNQVDDEEVWRCERLIKSVWDNASSLRRQYEDGNSP